MGKAERERLGRGFNDRGTKTDGDIVMRRKRSSSSGGSKMNKEGYGTKMKTAKNITAIALKTKRTATKMSEVMMIAGALGGKSTSKNLKMTRFPTTPPLPPPMLKRPSVLRGEDRDKGGGGIK